MRAVLLALVLLLVTGCVAGNPTGTNPTATESSFVAYPARIDMRIDPKNAAEFILNPTPLGEDGYPRGMVVTIEVLPQEGWRVDDWAGPVFDVAGNVAKITMGSSQTVVARMKRTTPMAASTANSTLRPLATKVPKPLVRPTPVPASVPLLPLPKGSASSYFEKGEGYNLDGKYQLAIVEFSTAIRLNPGYTSAYWARGWTHDYLNQYEQAIQDFDKAIQLDPYDVLPYISRGFSYYRSNSYHQAIKDFDKAIQLDPNDSLLHAMAYDGRSMAYRILGQDAKADADEAKACSLDSLYC